MNEIKIEKGYDLQVEELKENIINAINQSQIPVVVTELLLKDILNNVSMAKRAAIEMQKKQYEQQLNSETDKA